VFLIGKGDFMEIQYVGDPKLGIILYKGVLPKELGLVERLETTIGESSTPPFMWAEAMVGDQVKMPEYRDCVDCKISPKHLENIPQGFLEMKNIYEDTEVRLRECLNDYERRYNIKMDFMEAINYVKYEPGQHFNIHSDHGFSYTCTLSSIMYLNDGYEGGELWFPYFSFKFIPECGDVLFFPSTFIYAHASMKVTSGVKYSAVTMFDWNDRAHKYGGYGLNSDGSQVVSADGIGTRDNPGTLTQY
jgi:hypothetical protein